MHFFRFFFILCSFGRCFGQDNDVLKVPLYLEKTFNTSYASESYKMSYFDTIVKLQSIQLKEYAVFKYAVNGNQLFFENYKKGLIPDSIFNLIQRERGLHIENFSNLSWDHYILILIAILNDNSFIIIPDLNNNNNFDDDLVFDYAHYHSNELKVENLISSIQSERRSKL
jgi:hypothetical protein